MSMKKIILFFLLQLAWFNVYPISGRLLTPYFEAIKYYDYVVKGEVISTKERMNKGKEAALQIKVIDKIGQEISDTIWIEPWNDPFIEEYGNYDYYANLSGHYYFAIKSNEKGFFYDSSDNNFFALKITDGTVYSLFKKYRMYVGRLLNWLPFYRYHTFTKMKTDAFEKKLKRILEDKRQHVTH